MASDIVEVEVEQPPPSPLPSALVPFVGTTLIEPSSVAAGKMPISLLQECCSRRAVSPVYSLMPTEGQSDPYFRYCVTVGDFSAIGSGKNKKFARHLAAKRLLDQLVAADVWMQWHMPGRDKQEAQQYLDSLMPELSESVSAATGDAADVDGAGEKSTARVDNFVGKLNEMCVKRKYPPPIFDVIDEVGQAHEKQFVVQCGVGNFTERGLGQGRNKKVAKRLAAEQLLKKLRSLPAESGGFKEDDESLIQEGDDLKDLEIELARHAAENPTPAISDRTHSVEVEGLDSENSKEADREIESAAARIAAVLAKLDLENMHPCPQNKELLDKICMCDKSMGLVPNYVLVHGAGGAEQIQLDKQGRCQALVQLQSAPVTVCYGSGRTKEDAECDAALHALQYLKIMSS